MKVTEYELARFAKGVNDWSGWEWVVAIMLSMALNLIFSFMGGWAFIPVVAALIVYFRFADKYVIRRQVEKFVASKSSGEIQVDTK